MISGSGLFLGHPAGLYIYFNMHIPRMQSSDFYPYTTLQIQ